MCNLTDLLVDEPSTVPPDAFPVWKEKKKHLEHHVTHPD